MPRIKVKLAWIANDATRRATLRKRRKGLIKKVQELSTLCDIEATVVIYNPQEQHPHVWPSVSEASRVLTQFRDIPEIERGRKMMSQEEFLRQRAMKLQDQLRKMGRDDRELEMNVLMHEGLSGRGFGDLSLEDATSLSWMLEGKIKEIHEKMEVEMSKVTPEPVEVAATSNVLMEQDMDHVPMMMSSFPEEPQPLFLDYASIWNDDFYPFSPFY